jgi:galactose-1-phosphate uridylyltransferase
MGKITFESVSTAFTILNPFNNFAAEGHWVEVRKDPLLGDTSIRNPFLKDKAKVFFGENDPELIKKLVDESARTCIFCGESVLQKTARYPDDLVCGGRIAVNEAVLFANLFSLGAYHPVVALCRAHFLKLPEFTPELLTDGFKAAREFLRSVYRKDTPAVFATVNANYLFPAGASIVHPHVQMLVTPIAYSYHARMLNAGRAYYEKNGSCYFDDLINDEKQADRRYIAQRGGWHWLAAFSPMGSNEIMAVHENETDFGALTESDLRDLSFGISKVLSLYESLGHLSFNYTLFSVRAGAQAEGFRCIFKIINRQNLYPNYRNDDYFMQKMLQSELIFNLPEELAERLKQAF